MLNKTVRTLLVVMLASGAVSLHAATLEIVNANAPGVGFNDPTPVAPVGGNNGTTLGEQRLNVFKFAARVWGDKLKSDVKIQILASVEPLDCDATGAVLGAAGPIQVFSDFPNAPKANTWYPVALANKLAKEDLVPGEVVTGDEADIVVFFNSELGKSNCLEGSGFYLGLDGNEPEELVDFASTVLHEFGHGLGFLQATVDESTGERLQGQADVWEEFMYDNTLRKTWLNMTNEERVFSAVNARQLAWKGPNVNAQARNVLQRGADDLFIAGTGFNRFLQLGPAQFGPAFSMQTAAGPVVPVTDTAGLTTACVPLDVKSASKVKGNIALVDRGGCAFTVKVKSAQDAGAKAVLVADNVAGSPPPELGGVEDGTIKIISARVTLEDGAALRKAAGQARNIYVGPISVLFNNPWRYAGADLAGRPLLYTPNPFQPGSSVSHYDTSAKPNLLMEPSATGDDPLTVSAPRDLSFELLRDIGW